MAGTNRLVDIQVGRLQSSCTEALPVVANDGSRGFFNKEGRNLPDSAKPDYNPSPLNRLGIFVSLHMFFIVL
jgi:hypothetical protein